MERNVFCRESYSDGKKIRNWRLLIVNSTNSMAIFGSFRLPFLILTPACVMLGVATATWSGSIINPYYLALALIGAISAHISVNVLNEYHDFKSGLDFKTEPTMFSGGSGTLPQNPEGAGLALTAGIITLTITALIGMYFIYVRGLWLLPLGTIGLVIIVAYTKLITRSPFLCLIAPGLGFGPLMVMGTDFVLTGSYSWTSFVASLVPFFLVSDLLLLNQFPDVEADKWVGRIHLPIKIGRQASAGIYKVFLTATYLSIIFGYLSGTLPLEGFLALASIFIAIPTVRGVTRYADDIPNLIPYMGRNVIINIVTPVLLAVGLFIGRQ